MIGFALQTRLLEPDDRRLFNAHVPANSVDAKFVAYLRDKKSKDVIVQNLTSNW